MSQRLDSLLTAAEAACLLQKRGVLVFNPKDRTWRSPTADTIRHWCARGRLRSFRIGSMHLIHRRDLMSFNPPVTGRPRSERASPAAIYMRRRRDARNSSGDRPDKQETLS